MNPNGTNGASEATNNYIKIYHINGVVNFAKAYKYITEYCVGNDESRISVRETTFTEYEIAVYCNVVRHMRLCEYLENICADWN